MYNPLPLMGVDINFHKHKNHGLELRIFDWFPEEHLERLLKCLIWMCDEALSFDNIEDPKDSQVFNDVLYGAIWQGKEYILKPEEIELFQKILNCEIDQNLCFSLELVENAWKERWDGKGEVSLKML